MNINDYMLPLLRRSSVIVILALSIILLMPLSASTTTTAFALSSKTIPLKRTNPHKAITRLEIVAAVKAKYKGRILSIRKNATPKYKDCHKIKMLLDKTGDFMSIRVACTKY
jgi:hypothetical protein